MLCTALLAAHPARAEDVDTVSGASTHAHGDPAARAETQERLMTRLKEELGLSIEQQAVLADILRDYGPRIAVIMKQGAQIGWSVMDVAPKNPQYAIDTEATAQAAAEAAGQWVRTMAELRNAVYSILTQEQIATLEARIAARREAWQERSSPPVEGSPPASGE